MSKSRWSLLAIIVALVTALTAAPAAAQVDPIIDPIPEKPIPSGLTLTLSEFAQFPKSDPIPPPTDQRLVRHARINYLGEVPDGSKRMFTPDLNGKLYLLKDGVPHVYLDVGAVFAPDFFSGRGLGQGFGFATFHPNFRYNGKFYTVHTESGSTKVPDLTPQPNTLYHGVVTEWTATNPAADTFEGTSREVLRLGFAGQVHGIQQIDFNPSAWPWDEDYGLLYLAVGDGGQGVRTDDPQNPAIPHGKILRIDPVSAEGKYKVPPTNPFVGRPGVLGEIYAYGMRDPHRFSWDPLARNRLFLGHIGEHEIEAIYEVRAGDNLGWSKREGAFVFDQADRCNLYPLPVDDEQYGYTYPVAAYDHDPPPGWPCTRDSGHAVTGGFVYRGIRQPLLIGKYVFGDIVDGRVFYTRASDMKRGDKALATLYQLQLADSAGNLVTMQDLAGDARVDLRFGKDSYGELYLLSKANGKIWKVTDVGWRTP